MLNKMNSLLIGAQIRAKATKDNFMEKTQKGELSVEYILIVAIVAGVIFAGWKLMGNAILDKVNELSNTIKSTDTTNITK